MILKKRKMDKETADKNVRRLFEVKIQFSFCGLITPAR